MAKMYVVWLAVAATVGAEMDIRVVTMKPYIGKNAQEEVQEMWS